MTRLFRHGARIALLCAVLFVVSMPSLAWAQARTPHLVLFREPAPSPRREEWQAAMVATVEADDGSLIADLHELARHHLATNGAIIEERVAAWNEVSELLMRARTAAASLHEGEALTLLAQAELIAEGRADVAGAATWLSEVETAIGLVAAQAGLSDLSASALLRAATLDPVRGVRSAEAPPQVLAHAVQIARGVATGPTGSFRVLVDVPNARVLLDEGDVGAAPRVVRAPVGAHVLRVEAPGFLPYGQVIRVLPGQRPDLVVSLSRDPLLRVVDALLDAGARGDASALAEAQEELTRAGVAPFTVWLLEVGRGPQERALLTVCTEAGCNGPLGLVREENAAHTIDLARARLRVNAAWLLETAPIPQPPPPATPFWERWYVWAAVGALTAAAVGTTVWATRPTEAPRFEVTIDPGDLHR